MQSLKDVGSIILRSAPRITSVAFVGGSHSSSRRVRQVGLPGQCPSQSVRRQVFLFFLKKSSPTRSVRFNLGCVGGEWTYNGLARMTRYQSGERWTANRLPKFF